MTRYRAAVTLAAGTAIVLCAGLTASTQVAEPRVNGAAVPVLLELFTSEGCSTCPAADRLLTRLLDEQPVAHARVIALGEHVDYWDRFGWRDPFSSAAFTSRQVQYQTSVFPLVTAYTPQLVIDGTRQAVGSAESDIRRAIASSLRSAKGAMHVEVTRRARESLDVTIGISGLPAGISSPAR